MTPDTTSSLRSDPTHRRASARVVEDATAPVLARHHDAAPRPHASEVSTAH